ncbi:MAG: MBL fold metallo-hydrolase [Candidatus Acidiferrales bacterium]|jgi:glyoxylase-like metal-dependent hydrolase (beta-lactamase superfamily II)
MKLGDLEFHIIVAGRVLLDGGAMFGVIPRPLWEKKMTPDARNRITLSMNSLLIHAGGKHILVETGAGDKMNSKLRDIYGLDAPRLLDGLRGYDLRPEDIDIVVNTHLHFDHCGGNTRLEKGEVVPTFPNARYIVQRGEYDHAMHPNERDRASYFPENYAPIESAGMFSLLEGDQMIAPGVELVRVPGHTADMQCVKLTGGGKTAFLFADLVPTTVHLPLPWIMGYDLYPMTTLENKKRWIPVAVQEGWLALFAHDARVPAAYLRDRDGQWEPEPVTVD